MYRLVPQGLHDASPNPQPALPQQLHFCSSSSSLLRTYCFWPRLSCTELGCILFPSFSPGNSHNQSPGSLFGSPAASFFGGPWLCAPASRRGCPSRSASLRKMRLLVLLSASRGSHANIISASQCLGAGLPLFTELPSRGILAKWVSAKFDSRKLRGWSAPKCVTQHFAQVLSIASMKMGEQQRAAYGRGSEMRGNC